MTQGKNKNIRHKTPGRVAKKMQVVQNSAKSQKPKKKVDPTAEAPPKLMISVSGIRGIVGDGLTPDIISKYAAAFGSWCNGGKIIVGRDSRVSGEFVRTAVFSGLIATGCRIVDIGIVPTPTVEIAVRDLNAHGGIAITASHNPIEWNALKLIGPGGLFLNQGQGHEVIETALKDRISYVSWDKLGKIEYYDHAIANHIERILDLEYIDVNAIRERNFKIVLDTVNGAGSLLLPKLLNELNGQVILINGEPHGIFPRNPEPVAENLTALEAAVVKHGADIGFAVDPDADRLALVSNEGKAVGEEMTLALAVRHVLSRRVGPVVVNASTSSMIDDLASQRGGKLFRTKIGEIHVSTKMVAVKAVIGGEGNGGVILPDVHLGRDAATGIALILQMLVESRSVSELIAQLPAYHMVKDKIHGQHLDLELLEKAVNKKFPGVVTDKTDGLKFHIGKAWVHIRRSNTEPIARVIAEAPTRKEALGYVGQIKEIISRL